MEEMMEFRLVFYMNGTDAINFWGGRSAASPLAYYFHLTNPKEKETKVLLGGSFKFQGLGEFHSDIKDKLEELAEASEPISLPKQLTIKGEHIRISNKAYIYQKIDPLFTQDEHEVFWEATINKIGRFKSEEQKKYRLGTVQMGYDTKRGQRVGEKNCEWRALISKLVRRERPVPKDNCPWKVYNRGKGEQSFWHSSGMPPKLRNNVFVHATTGKWKKFDKSPERKTLTITKVTDVIDDQIKNSHIRESLVHELLKKIAARDGWWVNFEVPVRRGRIDFLINQSRSHHWKVIEVKLRDNPGAVEQLQDYLENIEKEVKKIKNSDDSWNSYFGPLWDGKGKCVKLKGVVLCADPPKETVKEVKEGHHDFDVWIYKFTFNDNKLGIKIWDAITKEPIAEV